MSDWTARKVLDWAKKDLESRGMQSPRLDAELLLVHALGIERVGLYMDLDRPLSQDERTRYRAALLRRQKHEPVAYILGEKEFYGLNMRVTPAVLIPRPETELLVDHTLLAIKEIESPTVIDVCTGSGCVAIAVAHMRRDAHVSGIDVSLDALEIARENGIKHGVQVQWREGDLLHGVEGIFDVVVSNPPYIESEMMEGLMPDVRLHEPALALDGGKDGLDLIQRLLPSSYLLLKSGGQLFFEIGEGQHKASCDLAIQAGFVDIKVNLDLSGKPRMISAKK